MTQLAAAPPAETPDTGGTAAITDGDDRYYEYPPTGEPLDSFSSIHDGTYNKPHIKRWYADTATAWCVDNWGRLGYVKRTQGRKAAIELGRDRAERERDLKADVGKHIHDVKEALILWAADPAHGADIDIPLLPEHLAGALYKTGPDEYEPVEYIVEYMTGGFLNWNAQFQPRYLATEMTVYNQPLGYAGTLDDIVELDGYRISFGTGLHGEDEVIPCPGNTLRLCGDTKTGKALEGTVQEQLTAYRRCPECRLTKLSDLRPMFPTDAGAVLHLRPEYPDGFLYVLVSAARADAAWDRWQKRVAIYREQRQVRAKPGTVIRPLRPDGTMPAPRLCDLAADGYSYALAPLRNAFGAGAELTDLTLFTEAELLAFKGIGPKVVETTRRMLAEHRLHLAGEEPVTETAKAA